MTSLVIPPIRAVALTVAGSDPSGGAGIQADLKTFHAFGVYGEAVLVALTAQNTLGVRGVHEVPVAFVAAQLDAVLEDIPPVAVKTGMLATAALVEAVADGLARGFTGALVVDPVMVATSGARLLEDDAVDALRRLLFPRAVLVTPNLAEAAVLSGIAVVDERTALEAGRRILDFGPGAVLVKGGHGSGPEAVDLLVTSSGVVRLVRPRIATTSTHGTGCTLSAAVTASLALGRTLEEAVEDARDYLHRALVAAPGLGRGHGPVQHLVPAPCRRGAP
jgi:hydroxymethylpyrimidine/phosphomethylpyrimidine kinase